MISRRFLDKTYLRVFFFFSVFFCCDVWVAAMDGTVVQISPNSTVSTNKPTYTWEALSGTKWYQLLVDDVSGNIINLWYSDSSAGCSSGSGKCAVTPNIALSNGSAKWWVRASNEVVSGQISSGMSFIVNSERSFLPNVTSVQKWVEIASKISAADNFAPSIVPLKEGGYRIFWNQASSGGIASAASTDGINFTPESGLRLSNGASGDKDCIASHPWVIQVENGYRMYYQGNANCATTQGSQPIYRVMSAFSTDGLNFVKEGVRIDIGQSTGLTQAAHGRTCKLSNGKYRMYFSANFIGKDGPADILGATSTDGLTWSLDQKTILDRGHDPTVVIINNTIYLYTTFLGDNFVIMKSEDGYSFAPVSWVEFYNDSGQRIEEFGDADILQLPDGRLLVYGSGKGQKGLGIYELQSSSGPTNHTTATDFNGDKKSDILWYNTKTGMTYLWFLNATSIVSGNSPATLSDLSWRVVGSGDFNGDGKADILWQNTATGMCYIWLMDGSTIKWGGSPATLLNANWKIMGIGDFDGDGKSDILWYNNTTGVISIWFINDYSLSSVGSPATITDFNWQIKGVGDFNGDGNSDILWQNTANGMLYIWHLKGTSVISGSAPATLPDKNWQIKGIGDFDSNSYSDILLYNPATGVLHVLLIKSSISGGVVATLPDSNWQVTTIGDFNGDGKSDIFIKDTSTGNLYVWLMDGVKASTKGLLFVLRDNNWQVRPDGSNMLLF
ncbi:MAG: VCBS repeat-containing protein [Nitrospirae bacterium]|nr:VCBS repeat-containing protein [Nitrospirota bacterium]